MNHKLPDVQTEFRKGRGTRDQTDNIHCITEKAWKLQKNIYFCFIDYAEVFDYVTYNKLWKILQEIGLPDHLTRETCMQVRKQQLEPHMEQRTDYKLGKEYVKAVYCHPPYLTYMQCRPCKMPGCIKHKLESKIARRNINKLKICR